MSGTSEWPIHEDHPLAVLVAAALAVLSMPLAFLLGIVFGIEVALSVFLLGVFLTIPLRLVSYADLLAALERLK